MLSLVCIKFRVVIEKGRMAQALGWVNRLHDNVLNYWAADCYGEGGAGQPSHSRSLSPTKYDIPFDSKFPLFLFDLNSIYRQKRIDSPDSSFLVWRFDTMRYESRFEGMTEQRSWPFQDSV